jgi:sigma-B regulation protein RsbU (phosphoserine phosphatase)
LETYVYLAPARSPLTGRENDVDQNPPAPSTASSVRESLRENPMFAGLSNEILDQIAGLVTLSTTNTLAHALRKVQLFEGLSDDDVLRIQQVAETVELAAGDVLFEEGKKGDAFYVVLRGRVELIKRARDGSEQKLAVAREGEAFGEMALLNQTPRSATARALEPARLLSLSRAAFNSLLGTDSFAVRMLRGISKALWATSVRFASTQAKAGDAREIVRSLSNLMQKSIQPSGIPEVPGFSIMALTTPQDRSEGESSWDWFRLGDDRVAFALLRARSEGLPAGYPLVLVRTLLRELGKDHADLSRLLARVNDALVGAQVAGLSQRVECALVALQDGDLTWVAAGPVSAAVVREGGRVVDLPTEAGALGVQRGASYRSITIPVMPGDSFLALALAAPGSLARAKGIVAEMAGAEARDVVRGVAAALPPDDPITGEVFENTILLVKCVEPADEPDDGRAVGSASVGAG